MTENLHRLHSAKCALLLMLPPAGGPEMVEQPLNKDLSSACRMETCIMGWKSACEDEDGEVEHRREVKASYLLLRYKPLCRCSDSLLLSHLI